MKLHHRNLIAAAAKNNGSSNDPYWDKVTFLLSMGTWRNLKDNATVAYENYPNVLYANDPDFGNGTNVLKFLGSARCILPAAYGNMGGNDFTIEVDAKLKLNTGNYRTIINTRNGPGNSGFYLGIDTNRHVFFIFYSQNSDGSGVYQITSPSVMAYEKFLNIVVERYNNVLTLYLDGVPVASTTVKVPMYSSTGNFQIGGHTYSGTFDTTGSWIGELTNIRLTNGVARNKGNFTPSKILLLP